MKYLEAIKTCIKKRWIIVVAVLLALLLVFVGLPKTWGALADSIANNDEMEMQTDKAEETQEEYEPDFEALPAETGNAEKAYIEFEDATKRTENEKHFYMSDGTYMKEIYAEAVHYETDGGKFEDIDNSLIKTNKDGVEKVKNYKNSFEAEFSVDPNVNAPLMSVKKGNAALEFYLNNPANETREVQDTEKELASMSAASTREKQVVKKAKITISIYIKAHLTNLIIKERK